MTAFCYGCLGGITVLVLLRLTGWLRTSAERCEAAKLATWRAKRTRRKLPEETQSRITIIFVLAWIAAMVGLLVFTAYFR